MIQVLDYGEVKLIDSMGSDESIVRSARVSYAGKTGVDLEKDHKLIHYLMKNNHTTPFESVTFTFYVKAPIFVFRQWHRHRTWSYNEVSARYTQLPQVYYLPKPEHIGIQSKDNKQVRDLVHYWDEDPKAYNDKVDDLTLIMQQNNQAFELYGQLLKKGWPRELARSVLPVSTYSQMFATVNLLNLFKFIGLRDHSHAQYEVQVYARAMLQLITPIVPVAVEAWKACYANKETKSN
jgi:thymidylate synthase (FAD)